MAEEQVRGARDEHYDLISVLYHATHGARSHEQYISGVDGRGDDELASFFREVRDSNAQRAERAKALFAARIGGPDPGHTGSACPVDAAAPGC